MKKLSVFIVDDERLAREEIKLLLNEIEGVECIGEAKDGEEAKRQIETLEPDVLLVDIHMPGLNGIDFVKTLENPPYVIFISAHDDYALNAFSVGAFDYLLKPVDPNRLNETFRRLIQEETADWDLTQNIQNQSKIISKEDRIFIRDGDKCWFIEVNQIRFIESDGNYVKIHFEQHKPMILRSLNSFQEKLDPKIFFRANRKFIINTNWITSIEAWFNGGLHVEMKSGEKIEISRRQAIRFKEIWGI